MDPIDFFAYFSSIAFVFGLALGFWKPSNYKFGLVAYALMFIGTIFYFESQAPRGIRGSDSVAEFLYVLFMYTFFAALVAIATAPGYAIGGLIKTGCQRRGNHRPHAD